MPLNWAGLHTTLLTRDIIGEKKIEQMREGEERNKTWEVNPNDVYPFW